MTAPNSQPDSVVAIHTHSLAVAMRAVKLAKADARAAGLDPSVLGRAIKMLSADPDKLAKREEQLGVLLTALGAASVSVEADLFERVNDETATQRADRIWRDGYLSAVLGDPCVTTLINEDAMRWVEGWHAFMAALDVHEKLKEVRQAAA
jgi:hypothetical protein